MSRDFDTASDIEKLDNMAEWLDSKFVIPGTSIRFGVDSLIGLIPGVGDTATMAMTVYLIGRAHHYKLPWYVSARMIWNALVDWIIGTIPLIGDVFDLGWKANKKNVDYLKKHL